MDTFKNWAFSICCASVSGGIIKMLLPEGSITKIFKTVFCVFFLCIVISPISDIDIDIFSFFEKTDEMIFSENKFIENSEEYIKSELISVTKNVLSENNISSEDILISVNISEDGSIDISKFTLILSDPKNISEIEEKIFQKTGIKPNTEVLGESKNG